MMIKKSKSIEFIYWFAYYNLDSPSVRYRGKYPLEYSERNFGTKHYLVWPSYSPKRFLLFSRAYFSALFFKKRNSVIVIQRVQSNFLYATFLKILIRLRRKDSIYDIDDADYLETNPNTIYFFSKWCETISAGSGKIALHLSQFNSKIIHTTSPVVDLNIIKKDRNSVFTIGWIGGFAGDNKRGIIELLFPALRQLDFDFKFIMMGVESHADRVFVTEYFSDKLNLELELVEEIDWNDESKIQMKISSFDVGIAILLDTPIQIAKSGIKAKQYLNNGVPVLSTDLCENNTVVIEGVNGFFCNSVDEFKEKLTKFKQMEDQEYLVFSKNSRSSIENFNHKNFLNTIFHLNK